MLKCDLCGVLNKLFESEHAPIQRNCIVSICTNQLASEWPRKALKHGLGLFSFCLCFLLVCRSNNSWKTACIPQKEMHQNLARVELCAPVFRGIIKGTVCHSVVSVSLVIALKWSAYLKVLLHKEPGKHEFSGNFK